MEIRALEQSDIKSFLEFYQKLANENDYIKITPEEMSSKFEKEEHKIVQKHNYKQIFIAIDDNEIVGYIALKRLHFARLRHIAKFDLGVLEDYQEDENVGAMLVKYAQDWAKENKIKRLEVFVIDEDENLKDLLKDLDFEKEGKRKQTIMIENNYFDEVIMIKEI